MNTALQSSSLVQDLNGWWYASSLPTLLKPQKVNTALQSVFLGTRPKRTLVCSQSWQELSKTPHSSLGNAAFGGILNWTTSRYRPSKHPGCGGMLCRTTSSIQGSGDFPGFRDSRIFWDSRTFRDIPQFRNCGIAERSA